jgi:hypothetical protein
MPSIARSDGREHGAYPDWKCDDNAANNERNETGRMSALILVEKRSYIRIIAVDGQCGPLRKMHRQSSVFRVRMRSA